MSHNIKPKQRRQKILFSLIFLVCSAVSFLFFLGPVQNINDISEVRTIFQGYEQFC